MNTRAAYSHGERSASRLCALQALYQLEMTGNGVITPGDTFSVWTDAKTRQTRKIQVATVFQGDVVNLTATFKTLASGLNHVDFGEVMVSAKQLSLQVQNFNYNKNN